MKSVLVVYQAMGIGGSTTSLLSFLNSIDKEKYAIDLLLSFYGGDLFNYIPTDINVLPPAYRYQNKTKRFMRRLLSPRYMFCYMRYKYLAKKWNNERQAGQWFEMQDVDFYREPDKEYDTAIAFLEGQQCKYVAEHVKAKKKIAWIHIDYTKVGLDPKYDYPSLSKFDKIVTVSDVCRQHFCECFPDLSNRVLVIENILSSKRVIDMASSMPNNKLDEGSINMVTSCRITFSSKGLDRAVNVISKLKKDGVNNFAALRWYIIGDGIDRMALDQLIKENGLDVTIILLGKQANPYPYLKQMTLFFLPSYFEGKPMSVTEGFMLGLPALVTDYSSAREQVRHGIDGYIVENNENGIYQGLKYVLENPETINAWKKNVVSHDYSNSYIIKQVEDLIDG